jgi:bacterioferritin
VKKNLLISKLNWFYSLELNQVDLYIAQSKAFKGSYESIIFERTAEIEQGHVENIGKIIKEFGGKPTKLGWLVSPVIGRIAGKLTAFSGMENTLKANIMIERKAMKDYTDLINDIQNEYGEELETVLKHNLADEDVHTAWFSERLCDYDNINLRE